MGRSVGLHHKSKLHHVKMKPPDSTDAIIRVDYQNDGVIRIDETGVNLKRVVATGIAVKLSCAA
jgi:hypothetical protein